MRGYPTLSVLPEDETGSMVETGVGMTPSRGPVACELLALIFSAMIRLMKRRSPEERLADLEHAFLLHLKHRSQHYTIVAVGVAILFLACLALRML